MRRTLLAVVAIAGCNQALGLDATRLVDAAAPDAPPSCAHTPLAFQERLEQVLLQPCRAYVTSDIDRALAVCPKPGGSILAEGRIDQPLVEIPSDAPPEQLILYAWLAPEGDRALVHAIPEPPVFSVYRRDETSWRWSSDLPMITDYDDAIGVPSRGPAARVMHTRPNTGVVDELVEEGGTWRLVRSYSYDHFGTLPIYAPVNLTADGLHVLFRSADLQPIPAIYHAARASIDEPFGGASPLANLPREIHDPFMTPDCGRVYFSGLSSVFYARQQ